jgi:phosphoribosylformylglycinamidine (FGAM) synthase PurS component
MDVSIVQHTQINKCDVAREQNKEHKSRGHFNKMQEKLLTNVNIHS